MYLFRQYDKLSAYLASGKVLVIYGPRRVGKTTLLQRFLSKTNLRYRSVTGDDVRVRRTLGSEDLKEILEFVEDFELLAVDEAQYIPNIGIGFKMIVDHRPDIKIIATGSSSFDLANQTGEPLTGRKRTLKLYPIAQVELSRELNSYDLRQNIPDYLVFGTYPEVLTAKTLKNKREYLEEIAHSYLLKDVLALGNIRSPQVLTDLLQLIAFQIGGEVSYHELGQQLSLDYKTVRRYLDLLEKTFVLLKVRGFSRNLRKEIAKKSKYYFYDTGIRNAIIANFNKLEQRNDVSQLWENFIVVERFKKQEYRSIYANNYFWRTYDQKEVDWVEEREGKLFGYEIKWGEKKPSAPRDWIEMYKNASYQIVNRQNYLEFVAGSKA